VPKRLDLEYAGAIATTGLAALQGIDDALKLKKGETVLIHGGSGGVGTLAIQFAKLRGARVVATGSGLDGVELVREMGADLAVPVESSPKAGLPDVSQDRSHGPEPLALRAPAGSLGPKSLARVTERGPTG
jgi:NADPH:quinone reductase-like Zn-dependent oxidoreductase